MTLKGPSLSNGPIFFYFFSFCCRRSTLFVDAVALHPLIQVYLYIYLCVYI